MELKCLAITATCGRNTCLRRAVGMFLNQDYENKVLLIHNNSIVPQKLDRDYDNIILINKNERNGIVYRTLGDIYNDSIREINRLNISPDVVVHWDDDDLYFPDHISKGIEGYRKALDIGKIAYKPKKSWYHHAGGVDLMENTLEPSIFLSYSHLNKYGYSEETTAQHLQWVNPLVYEDKIFVDPDGKPTLIYNWNDTIPTFKTSGDPHNPLNFNNYRHFSQDHGRGVIIPLNNSQLQVYYNLIN